MADKNWKASNYDTNVSVSKGAIDELKSRGTKEANLAYYKEHGATTEQREAMNRFYGKNTIASNTLASNTAPNIRESRQLDPIATRSNIREDRVAPSTTIKSTPFAAGTGASGVNSGALTTPPSGVPGLFNSPTTPNNRASNPARVFSGLKSAANVVVSNTPGIGSIYRAGSSIFNK